jgi:DNA (cytosine-5)-methyltransferase 1
MTASTGQRPKLLDLFCCAGGAGMGYHRAGFDVVGVDIAPQPHYPFEFHQGDALDVLHILLAGGSITFSNGETLSLSDFAAVHASPPCQAYSDLRHAWNAGVHPELIEPTRDALELTGLPWVIENVEGAPLHNPTILCGSMFGLGIPGYQLRRHRQFETSDGVFGLIPGCHHSGPVVGVYGDHLRSRGHWRKGADFPGQDKVLLAGEALGIDWMNWHELSQSIPPAYTEFIGAQLLEYLAVAA